MYRPSTRLFFVTLMVTSVWSFERFLETNGTPAAGGVLRGANTARSDRDRGAARRRPDHRAGRRSRGTQ